MRYSELLTDAWKMTWRNRWLWLFGLFAGTTGGSCSGGGGANFDSSQMDESFSWQDVTRELGPAMAETQQFLSEYWSVIVLLLAALLVLWLVFLVIAAMCQGALIAGGAELAEGRPTGMGVAWRRGLHAFGRLLALNLLLLLVTLVIFALLVAAVVLPVVQRGGNLLLAFLALMPILVLFGLAWNVVAVIVAYAQREIVLREVGPLDGLRSGWELFRANLGASILVWLLGIVGAIIGGIAVAVIMIGALIPAGIVGGILWALGSAPDGGVSAPRVLALALGGGIWLLVLFVAFAAFNTFLWNYWTIAYLRLPRRGPQQAVVSQPSPTPS